MTISALLITLVLIFAFQADNIIGKPLHVLLIAIPISSASLFQCVARLWPDEMDEGPLCGRCSGALIGASNFFELAVATAIALFGPGSGAALATVVGVLVEVPVMLSVCAVCNGTRRWFVPENTT